MRGSSALLALVMGCMALAYLVHTGRAFRWWDYPLGHIAEVSADHYGHLTTIAIYRALNLPGEAPVAIPLGVLSALALAWRRRGWRVWAALLPLLLLATIPAEYIAKALVHSPAPTPDIVLQPTLAAARHYQALAVQQSCPLTPGLLKETLFNPACPGGSFFSGAAARIALLVGAAAWWVARRPWPRRLRALGVALLLAYLLAAGVGRVYVLRHWVSDVVGGTLLGAAYLCAAWLLARSSPRDFDNTRR